MKRAPLALLALLLAPLAAAAQTPAPFPQTLPPNTVVGRLGAGTSGPAQNIPFTTLATQLSVFAPLGQIQIGQGVSVLPAWTSVRGDATLASDGTLATVPEWQRNILTNGDFRQWTLCPLFNCTMTLTNGALTGQSNYPITIGAAMVNAWPDSWSLAGTGFGGATTWLMRPFVPDSQTAVEGYPWRYSATTWTTAPTLGSTTEQPSSCAGPNPAFGTLLGCRNSYFDTTIQREFMNFAMDQRAVTMSVNARVGRRITNAVNNGSGLCRFTVATTSGMTTGDAATVAGVAGATTCNGAGGITVVDGATIDFNASFTGSYDTTNSDALISNQPVYVAPILYYSLGYVGWVLSQFPSLAGGYATNTGTDGNFYIYKATGTGFSGLAISAVANNGSGLCRVTVASTTNYATGRSAQVIAPGTGCAGTFTITVVDATHIDLQASTFSGAYTSGGFIGVPPVHITMNSSVSDGNISWQNVGLAKGRVYDLYEGQYAQGTVTSSGYGIGAAVPVSGGTNSPIGNACIINANWSKCIVTINLPPAQYLNAGDYAWSIDQPRQLLPTPLANLNFGAANISSLQAGVDMIGPIGLQEVDLAQIAAVPGTAAKPYRQSPHYLNRLASLPFADLLGYLPQTTTQKTGLITQSRYNDVGNSATFERRCMGSTATSFVWSNPCGDTGNPLLNVGGVLDSLGTLVGNGIVAKTSSTTVAARTITATAPVAVTNGDGVAAAPNITCTGCLTNAPAALTKTDDTNVTMTLGGTPSTALLQTTSLALGWTGTLAAARGGNGRDMTTAWSSFTPTLGCGAGSLTSASATGRQQTIGKTVMFSMTISITTNGTCASFVTATLPVAAIAANTFVGRATAVSGKLLQAAVSAGTAPLIIQNYDQTYPGANGEVINITGVYESN